MHQKWNREVVIRHILKCVAEGLPLTIGEPGISQALYRAGTRFFGSWRNAIQAAGLRPELGNCVREMAASENPYTNSQSREAPSPSECEAA